MSKYADFIIAYHWEIHELPKHIKNFLFLYNNKDERLKLFNVHQDFPGSPVVETLCFQCLGHRFDP